MEELAPFFKKNCIEVGCDEAGRGCLAGPVVAAAVVLSDKNPIQTLNDSKKLNKKKRDALRKEIEEKALYYAVAFVDHEKIDEINILNASILAMQNAIAELAIEPEHIIIDGNRFHQYKSIPHTCIIKGDGKYMSIAAASILAKTYRDEYMVNLAKDYPMYDWLNNKGYPTKKHREALKKYPVSPYHRKSFQLKDFQTKIEY